MNDKNFIMPTFIFQTLQDVFYAANNARGNQKKGIAGSSQKFEDDVGVRSGVVYYSTQELFNIMPDITVVWLFNDNHLSFSKNKTEWTDKKVGLNS